MKARAWLTVLLGVTLVSSVVALPASAAVRRLVVESREDVLGGRPFGAAGPYEKLSGIVEFRRHFPLITDNAKAGECVRIIAGWRPMPDRKPQGGRPPGRPPRRL